MFLESSRYAQTQTALVETPDGRILKVLKPRRLPRIEGVATRVQGTDRLDLLAHDRYGDGTRFWHIADANRDLWANHLVAEPGRVIQVPES